MGNVNLYFDILGLNQDASLQEVEWTYRDLLELYTKNQIPHDPQFRLDTGKRLNEIIIAYNKVKSHLFTSILETLE